MKDIIIWGYGYEGGRLYKELRHSEKYHVLGFADNSKIKQQGFSNEVPVRSLDDLRNFKTGHKFAIIIASGKWHEIGSELEKNAFEIEGVYLNGVIMPYYQMHFWNLNLDSDIILYAGDICDEKHLSEKNLYGLSINKGDDRHIYHDITIPYPLPDNSIFLYQAEDVLEHIAYEKVIPAIDEIYRILKPGCILRISLPDYNSPILKEVVLRDNTGRILYDPLGGGEYTEEGVVRGGHLWFPTYNLVEDMLSKTKFQRGDFLCYHTSCNKLVYKEISEEYGYVKRIHNKEIYSMVIDCKKKI